jgi:hypothetical protein
MKRPNHAIERTADPRHASCVRTCRATGRGPLIADVRRQRMKSTTAYIIAMMLWVIGCSSHSLLRPDVSRSAYLEAMKGMGASSLPPMPYDDWVLFQKQGDLHALYHKQLNLDVNDSTNNAIFFIVFESWGEFVAAERDYRKRCESLGVMPADAFRTFQLSSRLRRAVGQYEKTAGITWQLYFSSLELPDPDPAITKYFRDQADSYDGDLMISADGSHIVTNWLEEAADGTSYRPKRKDDYPLFRPSYVVDMQLRANEQIEACQVTPGETPYAARLRNMAEEELMYSSQAQADGDLVGAFQWAADALVTAKSATALWQMERRTKQSSVPATRGTPAAYAPAAPRDAGR